MTTAIDQSFPRARQIGLLTAGDNAASIFRMPVFPRLLESVQVSLASGGVNLQLLNWPSDGSLPPTADLDGVFVLGALDADATADLERRKLPVVWLMRAHSDAKGCFDHVFYNNDRVGVLAAQWVQRRGHKLAAFVNPRPRHGAFPARAERFAETLAAAGLRAELIVATVDGHSAEPLVERMLALSPRPTAIFVPNDAQLPGLYRALALHGLRPMQDIDVIGCDNEESILACLSPRPATIDLNLDIVGRRAVEQMLRRILTDDRSAPVTVLIEPSVVEPA
jgi:DNA-binding LacI/PurR family transcriptional regulator